MQPSENSEKHRESILKILSEIGIPEWKVHNIYIYGSRVYGTATIASDYDVLVTACSLDPHIEVMVDNYNIHVYTPDIFKDNLLKYTPVNIECLFLPEWAKLQEKDDIGSFLTIDDNAVKKFFSAYSYNSWMKAQRKIVEGDFHRGVKSLFHCLRILDFGMQIVAFGNIVDFSRANRFWDELEVLENNGEHRWNFFKKRFIGIRMRMHEKLLARPDGNLYNQRNEGEKKILSDKAIKSRSLRRKRWKQRRKEKQRMKTGIELIVEERQRQIDKEGYLPEHDDSHTKSELVRAASCYINNGDQLQIPVEWPWQEEWWKPSRNRIRTLVKAGALIAAEIDRLKRIENKLADRAIDSSISEKGYAGDPE